jgi:hypothetical protein
VLRFGAECRLLSTTYPGAAIAHHRCGDNEEIANVTPMRDVQASDDRFAVVTSARVGMVWA